MPFLGDPVAVEAVDDVRWRLLRPVHYNGAVDAWTVPRGYVTDFATVPAGLQWLVPRSGRYTPAAIVHDYLLTEVIPAGLISPRDADGVFRRVMRELGVPVVRRWLMWTGVRWAAVLKPWRRHEWWRDAPRVLPITAVAVPLLLPGVVGAGVSAVAYQAAEAVARLGRRSTPG